MGTAYRANGDDDSWFRHRIMNPKFSEIDPMGEIVFNVCNTADITVPGKVEFKQGITIEPSFSMNFGMSMSAEIKEGAILAYSTQTISGNWGVEFGLAATWSEETQQIFE